MKRCENNFRTAARRTFVAALAAFAGPDALAGLFEDIDPHTALQGSAEVRMQEGRRYDGELAGLSDGYLSVVVFDGAGEVEYSLPVDKIEELRFPGSEVRRAALEMYQNHQYEEALPFLEAIYRQRASYLPLLDAKQKEAVVALPEAYTEAGNLIDAVGVSRGLLERIEDEGHRRRLEALVLTGYFRLELFERTAREAREWCARQDLYPESALGWTLLAEIKLRKNRHKEALWIALQPISFSTARRMDYLERAYAAAIHSSFALEDEEKGFRLFQEMKARRLTWPDGIREYAATRKFFQEMQAVAEKQDGNGIAEDYDIDTRPAREDLNLPLRDVRKLLLALPDE